MSDDDDEKGRILGPDGNLPGVERTYRLGDLTMATNGSAEQVMATATAKGLDPTTAVAVFVGAAVEFDLRDQRHAALISRLDRMETEIAELREQHRIADEPTAPERNEPDPEEAERDYQERLRKIVAFFEEHPSTLGVALAAARITREIRFFPVGTPFSPNVVEMRRLEQWLDRSGGSGWA